MRHLHVASLLAVTLACGRSDGQTTDRTSTSASRPDTPAPAKVDACALVTETEATALFGEAAARESGVAVTDPHMIGECIWGHDSPTGSHQLQVRVWDSSRYYSAPEDEFTKPLALGEKGYVRAQSASGVDIAWVQGGRVFELSYFTVGGAKMPRAVDRVDAVTELARRTSGEL
jgi:hypothetical protein